MTRALAIGVALLVACGGDEGSTSNNAPPPPAGAAKPAAKPKGRGGKQVALKDIPKIEDRVTEIERPTIRYQLREIDFRGDPSGMENRDPFRSYVVTQGALDSGLGPAAPPDPTKECASDSLVATTYSLRDLRLVGIVTKGVNKYALFQDPSDYGHIVRRKDCLGREKAKVKDIGSGFVTLEVLPEPIANAAPRPPEERSIPLYPNELKLGESDRDRGRERSVAPPTMPAAGTEPVLPVDPVIPPPPTPEPAPAPTP